MIVHFLTFKILINSCASPFLFVLRWKTAFCISLLSSPCPYSFQSPSFSQKAEKSEATFLTSLCSPQYLSLLIHIYSLLVSEEKASLLLPKAIAFTSAPQLQASVLQNPETSIILRHSHLQSFQINRFLGLYEHARFSVTIK